MIQPTFQKTLVAGLSLDPASNPDTRPQAVTFERGTGSQGHLGRMC